MDFQQGAYIYINKPYRMSSFGALAHIRYVLSKRLKVKRVKMGHPLHRQGYQADRTAAAA